MADLAQLTTWRDALMESRYGDKRVTYGSDAEMANALADLERRIVGASQGHVSVIRIQSSKGL